MEDFMTTQEKLKATEKKHDRLVFSCFGIGVLLCAVFYYGLAHDILTIIYVIPMLYFVFLLFFVYNGRKLKKQIFEYRQLISKENEANDEEN